MPSGKLIEMSANLASSSLFSKVTVFVGGTFNNIREITVPCFNFAMSQAPFLIVTLAKYACHRERN